MKKKIIFLLSPLIIVYWYFFLRFVPPPQLEIGRETTYFTELTGKAGKIDLSEAMNKLRALPPENNGAIEMLQIFGESFIATDSSEIAEFCRDLGVAENTFAKPALVLLPVAADKADPFVLHLRTGQPGAHTKPWNKDEFPEVLSLIEANSEMFTLLEKMSTKTGFFWPYLKNYSVWCTPMNNDFKPSKPFRLLLARGMNKIASSDLDGAWKDFAIAWGAGNNLLHSDHIIYALYGLISKTDVFSACFQLLNQKELQAGLLRQVISDIDRLNGNTGVTQALESELRFFHLSIFLEEWHDGSAVWQRIGQSGTPGLDFTRYLDKNIFCRKINKLADELVAILQVEDVVSQIKRLEEFNDLVQRRRETTSGFAAIGKLLWIEFFTPSASKCTEVSDFLSDLLLSISLPNQTAIMVESLALKEKFRVMKVAAMLKIYLLENGRFPDSLDDLHPADSSVLKDSYSKTDFIYRREDDAALIYSVGTNLVDNQGQVSQDCNEGDYLIKILKP